MRSITVLTLIAIAFGISLTNRFYALLCYWWFAIFRPQYPPWIWMNVSALRLSLVAGLILVVPSFFTGIFPRFSHPLSILALIWLFIITAATSISGCQELGWGSLDTHVRVMLVVFLTERLLTSSNRFFWLVFIVATSLGFYSAKAGFFALLGGGISQYGADNLKGTFGGSNALSLGTGMIIFFLLASAQNILHTTVGLPSERPGLSLLWRRLIRFGLIMSIPFSMYNVASLSSRGSSLGLACGILFFIFLQRRRIFWILCTLLLVLLAFLVTPIPRGYLERLESITAEQEQEQVDKSSKSRPHFWKIAVEIANDHVLGVGSSCYQAYYNNYDTTGGLYGTNRSVHSSHFQVLAETGYMGLAIWIILFAYTFIVLLRVRYRSKDENLSHGFQRFLFTYSNACMASMVTFVIGGAFYELAHNEVTWLTFILAAVLDRMSKDTLQRMDAPPPSKVMDHHESITLPA